jgi:hypothetical protein
MVIFVPQTFLLALQPLMKKSLVGLCLLMIAAVGGYGQPSAPVRNETSIRLFGVAGAAHLAARPVIDYASSALYGPVTIADEGSELCLEEKEEKEEHDQKAKSNEFQFYSGRAASMVAPQRQSIKLSSKLYLLQAVLRI